MTTTTALDSSRLYDGDAEHLLRRENFPEHATLLPDDPREPAPGRRIRVLWGQDMLSDVLDGRYRAVVCGVNDENNVRGLIAQLVGMIPTSQWSERSVTSYAAMFGESVGIHAAHDREPYVLKYDLDSVLILALLRPKGRDHFTLEDLFRGFATVTKMLATRTDRLPVCSVSFLGARSNRLVVGDGLHAESGRDPMDEPSFESVLRTMHGAGFRGDIYPSPNMWAHGQVGVFPSYPYPEGLERMRGGSS